MNELDVSGGTADSLTTTDDRVFTLLVTPTTAQTTVAVQVPQGATQDTAGNSNQASNLLALQFDSVAPTVVVTSPVSLDNSSPIVFQVVFSEAVTGLDLSDFHAVNCTVSQVNGSGDSYTVEVLPIADGLVTLQVNAAAAEDAAGNLNSVSNTESVTYDHTSPTALITAPASPIGTTPVVFTITFDESVSGLSAQDFLISNGAPGAFTGSGVGPYSLAVTPQGQGTVTVQLPGGVVHDEAGNANDASNVASVFYNNTSPSCVIEGPVSPTASSPIIVNITFSAVVSGFTASDVSVTNGTKGNLSGALNSYSLQITPTAQGAVTVSIPGGAAVDTLSHPNTPSNVLTIVYDSLAPTATISLGDASPTAASVVDFVVTFNEDVGSTFTESSISTSGTLASISTIQGLVQNGNVYTVTVQVNDPSADGTLGIVLGAGAIADLAGNQFAGNSSPLYTIANGIQFLSQPSGTLRRYVGQSVTYSVSVSAGSGSLGYQWYFKAVNGLPHEVSGQTGTTLSIPQVQLASAGEYYCVVTYAAVQYASTHATLLTGNALDITVQPHGGTVGIGKTASLSVGVTGGFAPLHYEWFKDDAALVPAVDSATLTLSSVDANDSGVYYVVVTDSYTGAAVSANAGLTVTEHAVPLVSVGGLILLSALLAGGALRKIK